MDMCEIAQRAHQRNRNSQSWPSVRDADAISQWRCIAQFIDALMRRWTPLSDKRRAWLDDIVAKLERAEAV
jgi:hypothetical protein